MKLTPAMKEALERLHIGERQTARCNSLGYIAGQTMAALVRRGLARMMPETLAGERFYQITLKGLAAVLQLRVEALADKVMRDLFRDRANFMEVKFTGLLRQLTESGL